MQEDCHLRACAIAMPLDTPFDTDQRHTGRWLPRPLPRGPVPCAHQAHVHCFRCSMNTEDGAKLYDVCPHVSDSVRLAGGVGVSCSLALWAWKDLLAKTL